MSQVLRERLPVLGSALTKQLGMQRPSKSGALSPAPGSCMRQAGVSELAPPSSPTPPSRSVPIAGAHLRSLPAAQLSSPYASDPGPVAFLVHTPRPPQQA